MPRELGAVVVYGALGASFYLVLALGSSLGVLTAIFCQTPLLLAAVRFGAASARLACLVAVALVWALSGFWSAIGFLAAHAGPAALFATIALAPKRVGPDGLAAPSPQDGGDGARKDGSFVIDGADIGRASAVTASAVALICAYAVYQASSVEGGYFGVFERMIAELGDALGQAADPDMAAAIARIFPAMLAASWALTTVVNAGLALFIARRSGQPSIPVADLQGFTAPVWASFAPAIGLAVYALSDGWAEPAALALAVGGATPFFLQGLAICHVFFDRRSGGGRLVYVAFYGALTLFFLYLAPLIAGLGFADEWTDLRSRIAANGA